MSEVNVKLNRKQYDAYDLLTDMDNGVSEVLYGGGARGGKSWLGCLWQILTRLKYPGSVGMIARSQYTLLHDTTYITFIEVKNYLGLNENQVIMKGGAGGEAIFKNGSRIFFHAIAYDPKDPEFNSLGSYGLTDIFIDEAQEIAEKAISVLKGRFSVLTGHYSNGMEWRIRPKAMYSCNPSKGWIYNNFVKPNKEGTMESYRRFIKALPIDNPWITQDYIDNLLRSDKITIERLYYGNFEYDDDPTTLCDYDAIRDVFTNEHVKEVGAKSMSADIALKGHDRFVGGSWTGNVCRIKIDKKFSPSTMVEQDIKDVMVQDGIPRSMTVVDVDGVGAFLGDHIKGIREFHGGGKPFNDKYANLRAQCLFKLAELINARQIRIICNEEQRERITDELALIKQAHVDNDLQKKDIIRKEEIKKLLGHSPDYMDMLMMDMVFRLNPPTSGASAKVMVRGR